MSNFKLTYFGTKGVVEPLRYLMAHGNHKYDETVIGFPDWPKKREEFTCKKLPKLEMNGKAFNQSSALCRYFANQQGLAGKNEMENLTIDTVVDTIVDARGACIAYFFDQVPTSKETKKGPLQNDTMPTYMDHFEKLAKENGGHLACNRLTWADIMLAATVEFMSFTSGLGDKLLDGRPTLKSLVEKVYNLPGIKEFRAKRPKTDF